jgi:hypothetical protein
MLIDVDMTMLLSLIEDIDYGLDEPACEFLI